MAGNSVNRQGKGYTTHSAQEVQNLGFDEQYQVNTVAPLGYRSDIDSFVPLNVKADGSLISADATAQAIGQAVYDALLLLQPPQNNIAYARDVNDQMRVIVSNQANVTVAATNFWNNGTYVGYYGVGSVTSVDPREQVELQSIANLNSAMSRWTIT